MAEMAEPSSKRSAAACDTEVYDEYDVDLFPGLPDDLVINDVITRLPWHDRPVCRAVSKSWRAAIDSSTESPYLLLESRRHLLPLLKGHFVVCIFDYNIFMSKNLHPTQDGRRTRFFRMPWRDGTYQICEQWRLLPPLREFVPRSPVYMRVIASCGMLYAWLEDPRLQEHFVLKLNVAGGDWNWRKISLPHPFHGGAVGYNAKVYVPGIRTQGESAGTESRAVLVHDMINEQCRLINSWNLHDLKALATRMTGPSSEGGKQELYSFVHRTLSSGPEMEILLYDDSSDSWSTTDKIFFPDWLDVEDVELVNTDCFEPAPDGGINYVSADSDNELLSWFSSSLREGWVEFDFNSIMRDRNLEHLRLIHGQLYGMFMETKDGQDDEPEDDREVDIEREQDPLLFKRTIMKGTMVLGTKKAHWEEVLDVGCFLEEDDITPVVISPIEHYTVMD